ncbi:amidase [Pseudohaliea rubra]|uniref:Aspartyl-tRNA(Asn) amidotransferase subunit A n=1 Tax=Pseudohaliea rubra DSM 19751 TaxID=1265313 RepID=A0A095VT30_9GAMM|nr:amidase [Pseudohaliea rubra]KGE04520.1 Aspartyl-tRNA(Asn) amidotransferase subunit A [Pseudohaliea rubra DSM 19751]
MTHSYPRRPQAVAAAQAAIKQLNTEVNAVISDQLVPAADPGANPVPVLVKDCMDVRGLPTTCGSRLYAQAGPAAGTATVVARLQAQNAAIVGKANLTEFCFGATGENEHFGNCLNPWATDRITGGSSSGSAAAVASGMVRVALGTDTGGSVRIPAALCGVVGLRPTVGRVPNTGCLAVSTISDTIGPLAATVAEACWVYDIIQGYDAADPLSIAAGPSTLSTLHHGIAGFSVGVLRGFFAEALAPDIESALAEVGRLLEKAGARLADVQPTDNNALSEHHAFRFILADVAEARGPLMADAGHRAAIGAEVRRRIALGQQVTGTEYAASIRALLALKQWLRSVFDSGIDLLLLPTTPVTAPLWRDADDMVETTRLVSRFTYDLGASGMPSVSVPMGLDRDGLPMGALLAAPWGEEARLLRAAQAIEEGLALTERPAVYARDN